MSDPSRADAFLAALPRQGRGRLKVFLGAAAGVGKTCAMLMAAQAQARRGHSVLAGVVQTHGRSHTEALLVGLPQQPLQRREYHGRTFEELDLDGLLQAAPALALIDELAHDNIPGGRHGKRWQDVQELLAAGIDVYTTLNVQHLESLNDQVRGITGVKVQETVPDWVVLEAEELVLIDLPPRELLERLRDGKVYVPERARAAIEAFFTPTNLAALRELAMQVAAAQVDADLAQVQRRQGQAAPSVRGRLLVGVQGDEEAERLVRHASRVAQRRHLPWSLVHVDTGVPRAEAARQRLLQAQRLAERLGGEVVVLRSPQVAESLVQHAVQRGAGTLLVGPSQPPRWLWRRTLAERLLGLAQGLEINVLGRETARPRPGVAPSLRSPGWAYGLAGLATALASLVAWGISHWLELPNISLVFLAAVLLVAVRSSVGPALLCAGLSFLAYDFLFIAPYFSLSIQREQDVLTLAFFLLMATLTGNLAHRQREQLAALRDTQAQTSELLELSRKLAGAADWASVMAAATGHFQDWRDARVLLFEHRASGGWQAFQNAQLSLTEVDRAAADWAWQHCEAAGPGTATLPSGQWWWLPLSGETGGLALLGVHRDTALPVARRRLLVALGQPLSLALERARLGEELEAARLQGETEQLRSALLASVSHDLRTPLTAMRGSIESLQSLGGSLSEQDRHELLEAAREECERLDRYIQNLLDMTRLGHGALKLARDWVAPAELVGGVLSRLRSVLAPFQLQTRLPEELPLLYVHGALIEQALVNVVENAARFSPPGGLLVVEADRVGDELRFAVVDQGPGIAPTDRARIFDMFYTATQGDRGGQGTGLGLAICQGMVGAHGGHIEVGEGEAGRGTRIVLCLPLHSPPAPDSDL